MGNQTINSSIEKRQAKWAIIAALVLAALKWLPVLIGLNVGKGYILNLILEWTFWSLVTITVIKISGKKSLGLIFDKEAFSMRKLWWALLGIAAASVAMINHFVMEGLPLVFYKELFIISAFYLIIDAPMQETFWRGFVQKRLEYFFPNERSLSIVFTTLLWIIGWIPIFVLIGEFGPLWRVLFEGFFLGFAYYYTKRLSIVIIGHFLYNIGFILAHSYEFQRLTTLH